MKTIHKKIMAITALLGICFTLYSFSPRWGGDGFEIYLNNKLLLQQFGNQMDHVKTLQLDQSFYNDQLSVRYYHCGRVGKNRDITIKDGQNKILKEWRFNDGAGNSAAMNCPVKDILSLQKGNSNNTLSLYYSSNELPNGRLLVTITKANNNQTKP